MGNITFTPKSKCPGCKRHIDAAAHGEDFIPKVNDISICAYCQTILVFKEDLTLRAMSDKEWDSLPPDFKEYVTFERFRCKIITGKMNPEMN